MNQKNQVSPARIVRRTELKNAAQSLIGARVPKDFDLYHAPLCAVDILMVVGAPWLKNSLEKDYLRDKSGYRKIGGRANSPKMSYFFRSTANVIYYLKRQGFYLPRGSGELPAEGMACFFDYDNRGRFNFTPDRSGIVTKVSSGTIVQVVLTQELNSLEGGFEVSLVDIQANSSLDKSLIGYCDLP